MQTERRAWIACQDKGRYAWLLHNHFAILPSMTNDELYRPFR